MNLALLLCACHNPLKYTSKPQQASQKTQKCIRPNADSNNNIIYMSMDLS